VPKRTFWLVTGAALGAGSSLWAERKVRRSLAEATARLQPDALVVEVGRSARQAANSAGGRVRTAVTSGRDEMQRREEELWAELADHRTSSPLDHDSRRDAPPDPPVDSGRVHRRTAGPTALRLRRVTAKSASHLGN
jgi:hypothetical protein